MISPNHKIEGKINTQHPETLIYAIQKSFRPITWIQYRKFFWCVTIHIITILNKKANTNKQDTPNIVEYYKKETHYPHMEQLVLDSNLKKHPEGIFLE